MSKKIVEDIQGTIDAPIEPSLQVSEEIVRTSTIAVAEPSSDVDGDVDAMTQATNDDDVV